MQRPEATCTGQKKFTVGCVRGNEAEEGMEAGNWKERIWV